MIGRPRRRPRIPHPPELGAIKLRAIDAAARARKLRSLADFGAVWAVDGGYSFYALDAHGLERVVLCDFEFSDPVRARAAQDERVELVGGDFTSAATAAAVGRVDALIMFDVLLHQVSPDWHEVLGRSAESTDCLITAGPWWRGSETVRLLELGHERYLEVVPIPEFHRPILDYLDDFNDERGRLWRDCPDIWQWGITGSDLRRRMNDLGFDLIHAEDGGTWRDRREFEDCAYVFERR